MISKILNIIYVAMLIICYALTNAFICSILSQSILNYLIVYGLDKNISLLISFIAAIAAYSYLVFNHKIRTSIDNHIRKGHIK